jgi:hypothetical protein
MGLIVKNMCFLIRGKSLNPKWGKVRYLYKEKNIILNEHISSVFLTLLLNIYIILILNDKMHVIYLNKL